MFYKFFVFIFSFIILFGISGLEFRIFAVVDPLSVPNNRVGIHIFSPDEIFDAAKLVNSNGGDWGYVTIPIRSDDRDYDKWFTFFENARKLHIIPLVRLATYINGPTWTTPTSYDLVDFANFLNVLPWPTKNRYVILYNEPNHAAEWGGRVSPVEYVNLILEANRIFKERSSDFFLLSAGMDMSAPQNSTSYDALNFYRLMTAYQPQWYNAIDGLSVHAYPNPAFSASPFTQNRFGIRSFEYEINLLKSYGFRDKPIFITETGSKWDSGFYPDAFSKVWTNPRIVAITPFVLFAGAGDFLPFSLLDTSHQPKNSYKEMLSLPKIIGSPLLNPYTSLPPLSLLPSLPGDNLPISPQVTFLSVLKSLLLPSASPRLQIGNHVLNVEISDTEPKQIQGLSGRSSLPDNTGMLFIYPNSQIHTFWMKDMQFSLDFIWINDNKIVQISKNIPPPSQTSGVPVIISPAEPVNWILEVPAGFVDRYSLVVGDKVSRL